jgi:hypothetical protein
MTSLDVKAHISMGEDKPEAAVCVTWTGTGIYLATDTRIRSAQLSLAKKRQQQMEPPARHVRTTDTSPETRAEYTTA